MQKSHWLKPVFLTLIILSFIIFFFLAQNILEILLDMLLPKNYIIEFGEKVIYVHELTIFLSLTGLWILSFLLLIPLKLGQLKWHCALADGKELSVTAIFEFFHNRRYWKSIALVCNIFFRIFGWSVLAFAPGTALIFYSIYASSHLPGFSTVFLNAMGIILLVLAGILVIYISLKFLIAPYIFVHESHLGVCEVIRKAKQYSQNQRGLLFIFLLSFVFWKISEIFILPALYVEPYYINCLTILTRYLVSGGTKKQIAAKNKDKTIEIQL